jgi:hypothetical protein
VRGHAPALAGRLPAWAAGIAAALFAAGIGAALAAVAPQAEPRWPQMPVAAFASPAAGAALEGLDGLKAAALALFLLHVLERLTAGWQRRRWSVFAVVVAVMAAVALIGAASPLAALAEGAAVGIAAAIVAYGLLRFDARAVPTFCATFVVLQFAESALVQGTPADGLHVALAAVVAALVAWRATVHLARAMAAAPRSG